VAPPIVHVRRVIVSRPMRVRSVKSWPILLAIALQACSGPSTETAGPSIAPATTGSGGAMAEPAGTGGDVARTGETGQRPSPGGSGAIDAGAGAPIDDGPVVAPRGPLALATMRGPFASLDAYCAAFVSAHRRVDAAASCQPAQTGVEGRGVTASGAEPFLEARLFRTADGEGLTSCLLATRTARGWFVDEAHQATCDSEGTTRVGVEVQEIAVRAVRPAGAPLVLVRYTTRTSRSSDAQDETEQSSDKTMLLCGVGTSARPSCVRIPMGSVEERDRGGRTQRRTWQLRVSYPDETTIVIAGGGRGVPPDARRAVGRHEIVFP